MIDAKTPEEAARSWAANLEASPGVMRSDLEVMVMEETGCNRPQAHAAVLDATETQPNGGWQVKGRMALEVAIMRDGLARSGRSRAEIDAEIARAVPRP